MNFKIFIESSLDDLFRSTVSAYPKTQRRQYATDTINIANIVLRPFLGMRTLFVKALAQNEGREYSPIIVFKNVQYHQNQDPNLIKITENGNEYFFESLSMDTDVILRCNCQDFYWRFNYYDHVDNSLYGRKRAEYEALIRPGTANPQEMPGMCKHLIKLTDAMRDNNIII